MHSVRLSKNNIIHVVMVGDVSRKDVQAILEKIVDITTKLSDKGLPILMVADLRRVKKIDKQAVIIATLGTRDIHQDKIALVGGSSATNKAMETVGKLSGKSDRMKHFANLKEALNWLKQ